ncbi:MAG TPA: hypothetical protein P5544_15535 [Candidatus Nanopelagicales bacterium]|jgi:hypothetical protein|nr:hypothetical protein [Candidatus Nanopelagicales bacterium]
MFGKSLIVAASLLALLAPAAQADTVNSETGKIDGYTYGKSEVNSYTAWSGGMIWIWFFSSQHIGVSPAPVAGVPFYLHAHTAVIAPHDVTGNVLMTIDQDAGGLPLRYVPSAATPMRCSLSQFDPVQSTTPIPCPDVSLASGSYVVSSLEALVPGFALDIEFPVVVDSPTSGTAAMTAMWATTDVGLSNNNVLATVPVTVAANPNPPTNPTANPTNPTNPTVTKKLPSKLRKAKKVHSTTPKVCKVHKSTVVFKKKGVCKLVGKKHGHTVRAKVRY